MTWPEVFRWLALIAGGGASVAALAWTLGRIFRPWMRDAAQDAADGLYERLKNNDFHHIEEGVKALGDRIERVDARRREDTAAMEARIGDRIDRMGGRMEARLLAAVQRPPDTDDPEA
ncbi:MAG: hypothetical protein J4G03_06095 [Gemmatimonadetes bacterium]|nr:hypothetical protein [Gemmatimonadota bacterium]